MSQLKHHCHELSDDLFHVGKTLLYTKDGNTTYARVEEVFLDEHGIMRFKMRTPSNEIIEATRESLRNPDAPDIGWIPTSIPDKTTASTTLSDEQLKSIK